MARIGKAWEVVRGDLVARFAVAAAVVLALVGLTLSIMVGSSIRDTEVSRAEGQSVVVAQALSAVIGMVGELPTSLADPAVGRISAAVLPLLDTIGPVGFAAWAPDGTLYLGSSRSPGDAAPLRVQEAIDQTVATASHVFHIVDAEPDAAASIGGERWMQTFTPVSLPNGDTVVLQLSTDFAPVQDRIDAARHRVVVTLVGGGLALFALLLPILIRARRRMAEQAERLGVLLEQKQRTVAELQTLDTMKNTFLSAVSHELRTPLTVVLGNAMTIQRYSDHVMDDRFARLVDGLTRQALRLDRLLTDLLDVDRLSRGVLEPYRRPTELSSLVRRVVEVLDLDGRPVELPEDRLEADVDPAWVERILENLVRNAVKHTPRGSRITIELSRCEPDGHGVCLSVEDDGPGIPSDERARVFEPFARLDVANPSPGTGIGLSLVHRFAELHGGRVDLREGASGGCRFEVWLPATSADATPTDEDATRSEVLESARA